jgi:hypothetical protein
LAIPIGEAFSAAAEAILSVDYSSTTVKRRSEWVLKVINTTLKQTINASQQPTAMQYHDEGRTSAKVKVEREV